MVLYQQVADAAGNVSYRPVPNPLASAVGSAAAYAGARAGEASSLAGMSVLGAGAPQLAENIG